MTWSCWCSDSDSVLTAHLLRLEAAGVATSTRRTYRSGISAFRTFCRERGIPLLPASELTLRYFCAHLSQSVTYATIKVYLAGIRLLHIEHGFTDPMKDKPLLDYLCSRIRRSGKSSSRSSLPITVFHLRTIKRQLASSSYSSHDKLLYVWLVCVCQLLTVISPLICC